MCFFQRRKFKTREVYSEISKKNYNKSKGNIGKDNIKDNVTENDIKNKQ